MSYKRNGGREGGHPADPYNDLWAPFPELVDDGGDDTVPSLSRDNEMGQLDADFHFHDQNTLSVKNENRPDRGWQRLSDVLGRLVEDLQASRGEG
jgi:hypothetical protein